ncbi:DUF899 domain-containing protein [Pseudonocardia acaciae]|uniref:DUF899 domain-containing protein n=1 Tax=Pseudonocardia acaciae TaxID=551276 RepID=UPI00056C0B2E|nr:DUF899 domain-containing protein [Pseudonocardia acaciae]
MNLPETVSRDEWLAARKKLLVHEKELTRTRDRVNTERRMLPMVEIDKPYEFEGAHGPARLVDLFEGRRQLIVEHVMFDPRWDEVCPSCAGGLDGIGRLDHLHERDTTLVAVARAPYSKIEPLRRRMGWELPWYSSHASTFNHDFHVTIDESVAPIGYNYRTRAEHEAAGTAALVAGEQPYELHGLSVFLRDGDRVFHTYSAYGRGTESVGGMHYYLDLTALGRQEGWEEPKGRATGAPTAGDPRIALRKTD